jgi:hypothetical protein
MDIYNQLLHQIVNEDYSLLLFYAIFILIELRILLLLCNRITRTEDSLSELQTTHTKYCKEMENKINKYEYINNKNEIRNLRSGVRT